MNFLDKFHEPQTLFFKVDYKPIVREVTNVSLISIFAIMVSGCMGGTKPQELRASADHIAERAHFSKQLLAAKELNFLTYRKAWGENKEWQKDENKDGRKRKNKNGKKNETKAEKSDVHIYIEGDGRSYLTPSRVSPDPTPRNPLALKLAVLNPHPKVVYLARPCQFTIEFNPGCIPEIWTTKRFSEQVIAAMNEAVSRIKEDEKAKKIHLIGFSGGAAVAALIAARRNDVASLRTVAGDLDHEQMSVYHGTIPLDEENLNPMNFAASLRKLPQHHFAGERDTVVPPVISEGFVKAVDEVEAVEEKKKDLKCVQRTVLKGVTHHEGWEMNWPELIKQALVCEKGT